MKRQADHADDQAPLLPPHGQATVKPEDRELPCSVCREPAAWSTLSSYGARCGRCYAAYCRERPSAPGPSAYAQQLAGAIRERRARMLANPMDGDEL